MSDETLARKAQFFRLGPEDVKDVVALEQACFSTPWTEEQFNLSLEQKVFALFGLRLEGRLAAYAAIYHAAGELEILNIAVAPEHRRQGLGRRLLSLLLQVAAKMGITRGVLEVRISNAPAIALYESLGFTRIGVRPGYYKDTDEDALLYECHLSATSDA